MSDLKITMRNKDREISLEILNITTKKNYSSSAPTFNDSIEKAIELFKGISPTNNNEHEPEPLGYCLECSSPIERYQYFDGNGNLVCSEDCRNEADFDINRDDNRKE